MPHAASETIVVNRAHHAEDEYIHGAAAIRALRHLRLGPVVTQGRQACDACTFSLSAPKQRNNKHNSTTKRTRALRDLCLGPVVVQAREAGDVGGRDGGRVVLQDGGVSVGGVGHHHDLDVLGRQASQRRGLLPANQRGRHVAIRRYG